jgi:phage terminase small subunit
MTKAELTESQKVFADMYLQTGDAKASAIEAYPNTRYPAQVGFQAKNSAAVKEYIASTADRCARIQMEMIESKKTPAAVRNDAIKFRLEVAGVKDKEDDVVGLSIGTVVIKVDN